MRDVDIIEEEVVKVLKEMNSGNLISHDCSQGLKKKGRRSHG